MSIQGEIYYKNKQWAVTDYGFETVSEDCHYEYGKDYVDEHTFQHIGAKSWIDPESWIDAFEAGVKIHKLKFDLQSDEWKHEKEAFLFRKDYYAKIPEKEGSSHISDGMSDFMGYLDAFEKKFSKDEAA